MRRKEDSATSYHDESFEGISCVAAVVSNQLGRPSLEKNPTGWEDRHGNKSGWGGKEPKDLPHEDLINLTEVPVSHTGS